MDNQKHTGLLRLQAAELTGRTPFCPKDQEIAEFFDCKLAEIEHAKIEHHLSDCRYCLARIGILERLETCDSNKRVPEAVLATAKQLTHRAPPAQWKKIIPTGAVAAVALFALVMVSNRNQEIVEPGTIPPAVHLTEENSGQMRSVSRDVISLDVLNPTPGANIHRGALIQWSEVPGNLHYNIFVLSNAGNVLWTQRLGGTDWVLSESLQLVAGNDYFFRVEAQLPDGRNVSSRHIIFQVTGQQ